MGFGIKDHEDAMRLSQNTHGFIVGSALINRVEALWDDHTLSDADRLDAVEDFVHDLKHGAAAPAS